MSSENWVRKTIRCPYCEEKLVEYPPRENTLMPERCPQCNNSLSTPEALEIISYQCGERRKNHHS